MEQENFNPPTGQKGGNKLIILVIILTFLTTAVFIWCFFVLDKKMACPECGSQKAVDQEEWQTYVSEDYGYSLKYPSNWVYADDAEGNPAMFYDPTALAQVLEGTELLQGTKIEVYVSENEGMTLGELAEQWDSEAEVLSETETEVGGRPAICKVARGMDFMNATYVVKDGNFYSIIQYLPQEEYREIYTSYYNLILAGFEFDE